MTKFWNSQTVQRIVYFFPIQLLLVHVKKNLLLLFFWVMLFGYATGQFGKEYGIPYLFWDPEYLGQVDFWSFLLLGFACGGFIMAFHVSSYIMNAHRFPFLATLSKPFFKYSLNNSIIPLAFICTYSYFIFRFQNNSELFLIDERLDRGEQILNYLFGFYAGILIFLFPGFGALAAISRDVMNMFGIKPKQVGKKLKRNKPIRTILRKNLQWRSPGNEEVDEYEWKVTTYLVHWFKIGLTRDANHYDRTTLKRVFEQNHLIAAVFEVLILGTFIFLGVFREKELLSIPTGATIFLVCTMLLMFSSAIYSRLRGWSGAVIILIIVVMHVVSKRDIANQVSKAYGLNYDTTAAPYSIYMLDSLRENEQLNEADELHHIDILRKWKDKNIEKAYEKPRLVLICAPGGGARSALWAFRAMQYADSLTNGELLDHTHLITGASGGMFGLAYLRELKLLSVTNDSMDLYSKEYADNVGRDLLNPISTTLALNDLFIRWQTFNDGSNEYPKDRGYSLERQWNTNTGGITRKRLSDYFLPEFDSKIPIMIFSPNILEDGRSLYISSQPGSFWVTNHTGISGFNRHHSGIEFKRFFKDQGAEDLWFTSALRMNATFPYISPAVTLPSNPKVEVMDAGFSDTYGMSNALKYLYTFRNWISSNTSGVLIIQIRDGRKIKPIRDKGGRTILNQVFDPVGGIYQNLFSLQDYRHDQLLEYANGWFEGQLDVVDLEMVRPQKDDIALSWHLTLREKQIIKQGIHTEFNQKGFAKIDSLIRDQ